MTYSKDISPTDGLKSKMAALLPLLWGMVGLSSVSMALVSGNYEIRGLLLTLVTSLGFFVGSIGVVIEKDWGFLLLVGLLFLDFFTSALTLNIIRPLIDLTLIAAISKAYYGVSLVG